MVAINNLRAVEQQLSRGRYDRTYPGVVTRLNPASGALTVNVMGNNIQAFWSDPVVVAEGDMVLVQFVKDDTGLSAAHVRARVTARPRPALAQVATVPVGSATITVTGSDGYTYTATYLAGYTPVVGDTVLLSWNASTPTVQHKFGSTAPPPPPPPPPVAPPPAAAVTGQSVYWASASNTYWAPGGWGSWAGGKGRVYQGSYGSGPVYGAWFYGGAPTQLQGKTIDRMRIVVGSRLSVGNFNNALTINFYAHANVNQPGGNVTVVQGPFTATAWPGQGLTEYDLTPLAGHILNGAGILIQGEPYLGFMGRNEQAESGKLILDWRQ